MYTSNQFMSDLIESCRLKSQQYRFNLMKMMDSANRNYLACVSKDLVLLLDQASHSVLLPLRIVIHLKICAMVGHKTRALFSKTIFTASEPLGSSFNGKKAYASKRFFL